VKIAEQLSSPALFFVSFLLSKQKKVKRKTIAKRIPRDKETKEKSSLNANSKKQKENHLFI
jgi:hypothetical protein